MPFSLQGSAILTQGARYELTINYYLLKFKT